jgi:hypothetical protein
MKKSRFAANCLGKSGSECPVQSSHRLLFVEMSFMILQRTITVLAIGAREVVSMRFDPSALPLHCTHLVGGYS